MAYGPDNKNSMNWGMVVPLTIPRYAEVKLTFSSDAKHENAICIYDSGSAKIIEKGNQAGRNMNPETIKSDRLKDRVIYISGWHKNGPANGKLPWVQSAVTFRPSSNDNNGSGYIGFEDGGDQDYNDIAVNFVFE